MNKKNKKKYKIKKMKKKKKNNKNAKKRFSKRGDSSRYRLAGSGY